MIQALRMQAYELGLIANELDPDTIAAFATAQASPERRLLVALLSDALGVARGKGPYAPAAYAWLSSTAGADQWGTAAFVCEVLGLDQRAMLKRWHDGTILPVRASHASGARPAAPRPKRGPRASRAKRRRVRA